jgi:hypothetical protein
VYMPVAGARAGTVGARGSSAAELAALNLDASHSWPEYTMSGGGGGEAERGEALLPPRGVVAMLRSSLGGSGRAPRLDTSRGDGGGPSLQGMRLPICQDRKAPAALELMPGEKAVEVEIGFKFK